MSRKHVLFIIMATIWGLTWIAIKTGVEAVPPFFFASVRLLIAGSVLLLLAKTTGVATSLDGFRGRILLAGVLVNTVAHGMIFWGMQYVPSGISSVVNLALIPVGLFTIGLAAKEETYSTRKAAAIALGVSGLMVLFLPKLSFDGDRLVLLGMVALVVGTLAYCGGSILSRPLLRQLPPLVLSGWLGLVGSAGLAILAFLFEPIDRATIDAFLAPRVVASSLFLAFAGSIIAFTIYLRLLRDWGPARAGLYAFVSPIIAAVLAALLLISAPWRLDVILERGHILVGMTGDYRPFSNLREDGTFEGLDVEAALSLAGALGVDVRFVKTSWPTLVQGILEGRYDIAMSGVTRTLERQKVVGLSNGYLSIGKCPLIRASDQDRLTGLETIDRPGIRIGVNPGGTNESFVRVQISKAEIIVFENNLAIPEAVATGRVDVMITDNVEAVLAARRDPRLHAVAPDRPLTREELSDMIPRDDPVFLNWINL